MNKLSVRRKRRVWLLAGSVAVVAGFGIGALVTKHMGFHNTSNPVQVSTKTQINTQQKAVTKTETSKPVSKPVSKPSKKVSATDEKVFEILKKNNVPNEYQTSILSFLKQNNAIQTFLNGHYTFSHHPFVYGGYDSFIYYVFSIQSNSGTKNLYLYDSKSFSSLDTFAQYIAQKYGINAPFPFDIAQLQSPLS